MGSSRIDYSNLIEKINVLYEFMNGDKSLYVKTPNPKLIVVRRDIKKHTPQLDCLTIPLEYRESDKYRVYFNATVDGKNIVVSFGAYKGEYINLDQQRRREIVDMLVTHLLSPMVSVPMPIVNFDVTLGALNERNDNPSKFLKRIYTGLVETDYIYVNVSERFSEYNSLKKLILDKDISERQLKLVCLLVIIWLCKTQLRFQTFRHNSLGIGSILVYKTKMSKVTHQVATKRITIDTDISIRVRNFFNSSITGVIESAHSPRENPYYDIFYFFQSLKAINGKATIPESVMSIVNTIVPEANNNRTRIDEAIFQLESVGMMTAYDVLIKNNFFSSSIDMNIADTIESDNSFGETDIVASDVSGDSVPSISGKRLINDSVELVTEDDSSSESDVESIDSSEGTEEDMDFVATESIARAYGEVKSSSSEEVRDEGPKKSKMAKFFGATRSELETNAPMAGNNERVPTRSQGFKPRQPHSMVANIILSKLPESYYGPVPDHFVSSLPSLSIDGQPMPVGSFNGTFDPMQQTGGGNKEPLVAPGILKKKDHQSGQEPKQ